MIILLNAYIIYQSTMTALRPKTSAVYTEYSKTVHLLSSGRDACQGDSGGPLMMTSSSGLNYELIGLTSFGKGCADPQYPGEL